MRVQKFFTKGSRTKQSFKAECDVNLIMKKFKKKSGAEFLTRYQGYVGGTFGDFSEVVDYRTALEQVARADEVFMALPAKVRSKFSNDAAQFLDFVQNPANRDELVKMGLANSPKNEEKQASPTPVGK